MNRSLDDVIKENNLLKKQLDVAEKTIYKSQDAIETLLIKNAALENKNSSLEIELNNFKNKTCEKSFHCTEKTDKGSIDIKKVLHQKVSETDEESSSARNEPVSEEAAHLKMLLNESDNKVTTLLQNVYLLEERIKCLEEERRNLIMKQTNEVVNNYSYEEESEIDEDNFISARNERVLEESRYKILLDESNTKVITLLESVTFLEIRVKYLEERRRTLIMEKAYEVVELQNKLTESRKEYEHLQEVYQHLEYQTVEVNKVRCLLSKTLVELFKCVEKKNQDENKEIRRKVLTSAAIRCDVVFVSHTKYRTCPSDELFCQIEAYKKVISIIEDLIILKKKNNSRLFREHFANFLKYEVY